MNFKERIGKISNLSPIIKFVQEYNINGKKSTAVLSYKRIQDNRKAKILFNGFVFCGNSLEFEETNEVEIDMEQEKIITMCNSTQTTLQTNES